MKLLLLGGATRCSTRCHPLSGSPSAWFVWRKAFQRLGRSTRVTTGEEEGRSCRGMSGVLQHTLPVLCLLEPYLHGCSGSLLRPQQFFNPPPGSAHPAFRHGLPRATPALPAAFASTRSRTRESNWMAAARAHRASCLGRCWVFSRSRSATRWVFKKLVGVVPVRGVPFHVPKILRYCCSGRCSCPFLTVLLLAASSWLENMS